MIEAIFTLGSAFIILGLGIFVLFSSPADVLRRWFLAFCAALSFWQIIFLLSERPADYALLYNRLTFVGPLIAVASFFFFIRQLVLDAEHVRNSRTTLTSLLVLFLSSFGVFMSLTPLIVAGINPRIDRAGETQGFDIIHGPLYVVYPVIFVSLVAITIATLTHARRVKNSRLRQRTTAIIAGMLSASVLGTTTNIILPIALGTSEFSYLGGIAVVLMGVILSVAIAKQKLIDVPFLVARSFVYIASVGIIVSIYALSATFIFGLLLDDATLNVPTQIGLGIVFVLGSILFQPIKRWFDRVTNKLFYHDGYDSEEFIRQLNSHIVSTLDVEVMLGKTVSIVEDNLKCEFCVFGLKETARMPQRVIGRLHPSFTARDIEYARKATVRSGQLLLTVDETMNKDPELHRIMRRYGVDTLVRLVPPHQEGSEGIGYILLGAKKSGNPYNTQDRRIINIIANELVIALQNAMRYEEIERFNETLQDKITAATKKLRRTNEKLVQLDEAKDEFISMASHQLRTPLTSIKGYLSMVLEGDAGNVNPTQRKMLDQAFVSSQRMVALIADLLNVSRLKNGKFVIEPSMTNLAEVVRGEVAQLKETAAGRRLELTYEEPETFPTLYMDETKTRQVIMNFVDNAIYYTPAGGHIAVRLSETASSIEFTVTDDGIGVPKSEQYHLFSKFYRAGNARKARPDGTGLGLFMAKKVIVAQGGAVLFKSQPGQGSTFGFTFAKAKLQPPPATKS